VADLGEREGFPELELVREVTERYLSARYGGAALDPGDLERLGAAVSALRRMRVVRPTR